MSHICFMLSYRQYEYLYRYMLLPTLTQLRCDQVCLLYLTCVLLPFIMYPEYASSEFLRNYVPLWVLFRKWGMKGVCLRKRWGKCCRRCIGKLIFLAFIEWIGGKLCTHQCECVGTKNSFFTEEQLHFTDPWLFINKSRFKTIFISRGNTLYPHIGNRDKKNKIQNIAYSVYKLYLVTPKYV